MRPIPKKIKDMMSIDPFYRRCSLWQIGGCGGRITIEHAIIFGGRQYDELWSLIPLCAKHHGVDEYQDVTSVDKERSEWVALNRATNEELQAISKAVDYQRKRNYLNEKFGSYPQGKPPS